MPHHETPETIFGYVKGILKFFSQAPFVLFATVTSIIIPLGGSQFLIDLYANPHTHFVIALSLVELGYFSADRTLTNYLRNVPLELKHKSALIMTPSIIFICLISSLGYFTIFTWAPFLTGFNEETQEQLKSLFTTAQVGSLGNTLSFIIFFYGNRIWKNIRKRDLNVDAAA